MDTSILMRTLLYPAIITILVCILQAFLSSRSFHYLGLILPLATFAFSLVAIQRFQGLVGDHGMEGMEKLGWYALQLGIGNLPTMILLLVYSMFKPRRSHD